MQGPARSPSPSLLAAVALCALLAACADDPSATDDAGSDTGSDAGGHDAGDSGAGDLAIDAAPDQPDGSGGPDGSDAAADPAWFDGTYLDGGDPDGPAERCNDGLDNNGDGAVDCNDPQCQERLVCTVVATAEAEPNGTSGEGQELTLPLAVQGTIGPFTTNDEGNSVEDRDWYVFTIDQPTVVRWVLDDTNALALLRGTIVGLDDGNSSVVRRLDVDTPGFARQAYLARPGRYGVEVRDARNTSATGEEQPYGGDDYDYAMLIEPVTIAPEAVTVPVDSGPRDLGVANAVRFLDFELEAGRVLEAEVFAERLSPSSGLDAVLYLVDRDDASVIVESDDAPISTVDPLLRTGIAPEARRVRLVLDAFHIRRGSRYELFVDSLAPSQDLEPNNPIHLAFPVSPGVDVEGSIGAPFLRFRSVIRDFDYYIVSAERATTYVVEVASEGAELDASVRTGFRSRSGSNLILSEVFVADPPDSRDVRLEAASLFDASMIIEVTDRRHVFAEGETVGADEGFEYTLTVTPFERTFEPMDLPFEGEGGLDAPGEMDWFELTAPPRTRLVVGAIEEAGEGEGVEPWVYLTNTEDAFLRRGRRQLDYLSAAETVYRLGVVDRRAGGGEAYGYTLTVDAEAHAESVETEPNDAPDDGAEVLEGAGPWWIEGTLEGTSAEDRDHDVFLVTAEAGMRLTAETTAGADPERDDANTALSLEGPGIAEPVVDQDSGSGAHARILDYEVLEAGELVLTLTPFCNADGCQGGDYGFSVRLYTP